MSTIRTDRDLIAWPKTFGLGLPVHRAASAVPDHERFGLTSQMRRGAVSVPSNIAEGYGRGSAADSIRFLKVSRGALYELDTQLLFAVELAYIAPAVYASVKGRLDESERVLAGLIQSLDR